MSRVKQSPVALAAGMKRNQSQGSPKPAAAATGVRNSPSSAPAELTPEQARVKWHLRCPACWNNPEYRGRGRETGRTQINGPLNKIYYKCDTCGTTFQNEVRTEPDDRGRTRITIDSAVEYEVTPQGLQAETSAKESANGQAGNLQSADGEST